MAEYNRCWREIVGAVAAVAIDFEDSIIVVANLEAYIPAIVDGRSMIGFDAMESTWDFEEVKVKNQTN